MTKYTDVEESGTARCVCVSFRFWFSLTMYQGLGWVMMVLAATRLICFGVVASFFFFFQC